MSTTSIALPHSVQRSSTLGLCWILYGIVRIAGGIWLIFFTPTATVMFGALLNRVPNPFPLMFAFHFFYTACIVLAAIAGVFSLVAGLMLVGGRSSARRLTIVAAVLSVSDIPLGTTLGAFTLALLLP